MKSKPTISIIIRTLNEAAKLRLLLEALRKQTYESPVEIIVVDNESTDGTVTVAKGFGAKNITIARDEFTYPKSMNLGIKEATGDLVVLTVGHVLPVSKNWLSNGAKHFTRPKVAGVYSYRLPNKNAKPTERLLYWIAFYHKKIKGVHEIKKVGMGTFIATNIMIRKNLWGKHCFDESYEQGGEDTMWANWAIKNGYEIIYDPSFAVYHSHGLSLLGIIKENLYYKNLKNKDKFDRDKLSYRKDLKY